MGSLGPGGPACVCEHSWAVLSAGRYRIFKRLQLICRAVPGLGGLQVKGGPKRSFRRCHGGRAAEHGGKRSLDVRHVTSVEPPTEGRGF